MRRALSVFIDILLILAGLFGLALLIMRLAGVRFLAVKTGSMSEECPVGSIVAVYDCDPEKVKTDDIITYLLDGESDTYVTHRVISIDTDGRCFVTQGDSNNTPDQNTVPFSSFLGKVIFCIPKLGYALLWLGNNGKWVLVGAVVAAVLIGVLIRFIGKIRHKSKERGERNAGGKAD